MTNPHEEQARLVKVATIVKHLRLVHEALPPRLPIHVWAAQTRFPFGALVAASGAKPASPTTRAMVLAELERVA